MSCQIRRLINQRRDQSSPLTDGKMEARHWWRHFLSSSLTSSSTINRKQNNTERESVACGEAQRVSKDSQRQYLHAGNLSVFTALDCGEDRLLYLSCCLQYCIYMCERDHRNFTFLIFLGHLFEARWTYFKVKRCF